MRYLEMFESYTAKERKVKDEIYSKWITNVSIHTECTKYGIENYTINEDGSIDVDGHVDLGTKNLYKIPLKFNIVTGSFTCNGNKLTDLDGCPNYVGGNFICSENKLTTLKGCPQEVGGMFNCHSNRLKTLEYCPSEVGENFHCEDNLLTELDISSVIGGDLYCSGNMIDPDNCNFYGEVKGKISF